jgi:hypothetical protein
MTDLVNAGRDRCCVCRKRAVGASLSGHTLCADHWEWAEGEAQAIADEGNAPLPKRKYTVPAHIVLEARVCEWPKCGATYQPLGKAAKYCPEHSDAQLRKRRQWKQLADQQRRRATQGVAL